MTTGSVPAAARESKSTVRHQAAGATPITSWSPAPSSVASTRTPSTARVPWMRGARSTPATKRTVCASFTAVPSKYAECPRGAAAVGRACCWVGNHVQA